MSTVTRGGWERGLGVPGGGLVGVDLSNEMGGYRSGSSKAMRGNGTKWGRAGGGESAIKIGLDRSKLLGVPENTNSASSSAGRLTRGLLAGAGVRRPSWLSWDRPCCASWTCGGRVRLLGIGLEYLG